LKRGRTKYKSQKERQKELGIPGEGVVQEEKFPHSRKSSHRQVCGEFWNLRWQHNQEENTHTHNMHLTAAACGEVALTLSSTTNKCGLDREAQAA